MRKIKQIFESVRQKLFLGSSLTLKNARFLYLIPMAGLIITTLIFGAIIYTSSEKATFAAPTPITVGDPSTLQLQVLSQPLSFTGAEAQASSFKFHRIAVAVNTTNPTGATSSISSVDENTDLVSTDPSNTQRIASISSPTQAASFSPATWGYCINTCPTYQPIPKHSTPAILKNQPNRAIRDHSFNIGMKASPNLTPGIYSKDIIISAVTNYAPTTANLLNGKAFNARIKALNTNANMEVFRRSSTPPANLATATIVSKPTSSKPVYAWYDSASKTMLWWSDADFIYADNDSSEMFKNLNSVGNHMQLLDISGIDMRNVQDMSYMFSSNGYLIKHLNLGDINTKNANKMNFMFSVMGTVPNPIAIDPIDLSKLNTSNVTEMLGMFHGSYVPTLDVSNFDMRNVENIFIMFAHLKNVTTLDVSHFQTPRLNWMTGVFQNSSRITSLDLSSWNTSAVKSMNGLFSDMSSLNSLNISNFNTSNVTTMAAMFNGAKSLTSLDLSHFDTSKVIDMVSMFKDMQSLQTINLSGFNTSNVKDMSYMFLMTSANKPPITDLDLSSFNTSKVTNMQAMFAGLTNLQSLNLSSFDTRNVTNMQSMFSDTFVTHPNGVLDISSFDTSRVNNMSFMFWGMKVKTIYASPSFVTNSLSSQSSSIFAQNDYLTGGNGTTFAPPNHYPNFAHIDVPGNPGYFTRKP